jgi:hypothetical protein
MPGLNAVGVLGSVALGALLAATGCAAARGAGVEAESPHAQSLPVRSVRLYETGVGYFEREGVLAAGTDSISLPASHVDDALKTLLVLSKGAVRVSGVEFESVLSEGLARAQAGLPPGKGRLTYPVVLESLRGVEVEVAPKKGEKLLGRLVDVTEIVAPAPDKARAPTTETKSDDDSGEEVTTDANPDENPAQAKPVPLSRYAITVVTAKGSVVRLDSEQIESLRPTDPALAARLLSAIGTASERGAQAERVLRISASGAAPVRIGYIAETPVWRVTYRMLLGNAAEPATVQGWVLVHNDTDEAWNRTELEIVNGRPDSFLLPLTAPRYLRRPLATPEEMSTLPQLSTKTADQIWGDRENPEEEAFGAGGLGLSGIGTSGGGTGEGYGAGHGRLGGSSSSTSTSGKITVGDLAAIAGSDTEESGARFHYRMAEPVTLGAHSSALVPFTQVSLKTLPVTRFSTDPDEEGRTAVQVTNTSKQTLPAGPLAVYESNGFVGEAVISRLVPGQEAWVSFGVDLDVEVERRAAAVDISTTKLVEYDSKILSQHYLRHREQPIHLANKSSLPRTVCLEVDVVNNATVRGADRLLYDQAEGKTLAVFDLAPRSRLERRLVTEEGLTRSTRLEFIQESYLGELAALPGLPAPTQAALLEAQAFLVRQGAPAKERQQKAERLRQLDRESERLEKTIEKLNGTDGAEPLVKRVVELERLRNQLEEEQQRLEGAEAARLPALAGILERVAGGVKSQ